jgi:hypothetical protein
LKARLEETCAAADVDRRRMDHDHQTGRIRGLLCALCNVAIGYLREDPELFDRAKTYLTKNS